MRLFHQNISLRRFPLPFYTLVLFSLIGLLLTLFSGCVCCAPSNSSFRGKTSDNANAEFEKFVFELFRDELSENTLSLHYTVSEPMTFSIKDYSISLGNLSSEYRKTSALCLNDYKKTLLSFANKSLSQEEQLTYEILSDFFDTQIALSHYDLYQEILTPCNGIESQLPILFAEYSFGSKQDVEDYLSLIATTDSYFSQIIDFEKEKGKAGLFMSDKQCSSVLSACEDFLSNRENNILFSSFEARLSSVSGLSSEEAASYIEENKAAVTEHVFVAYENLIDELTMLLGCGKNDWGLCYYKNGADYYELLVQADTGCDLSVDEIDTMITETRNMDLSICDNLQSENPNLCDDCSQLLCPFPDEDAIFSQLQSEMTAYFPQPASVNYSFSYMDDTLQDSLAPAFYITAPIDNPNQNRIYLNPSKNFSDLSYFTTLAHEGFPGHLYQTVMTYHYELPAIRSILDYPGYTEGWATYVEMLSYYFADLEPNLAKLLQHNQSAILSLYASSDIGIHYYGWKNEELYAFWEQYGITDTGTIDEIAQLIISEPGNYLKYYVGYLQFEKLRAYAQEHFGDDYSPVTFHKAVLDIGPAPFDIIKKYLDVYYQ